MQEQRVEFAQRHEDEPATVHARMRHHEIRFVDDPLAVEQDIQIDGPGARSIVDRKSTRLNSSHPRLSRMPSSA